MTRKQQDEPSWLENYFEGVITNDAPVWRWSAVDDFGDALQREILYNLTTHNSTARQHGPSNRSPQEPVVPVSYWPP